MECVRLNPASADSHLGLGVTCAKKGEADRAIAEYTEALRLDPKLIEAYANRAIALGGKRDYKRSIVDCTEAVRLDPKNATLYHVRGVQFQESGDLARAYEDFTQAIKLDPGRAASYVGRGCIRSRRRGEGDCGLFGGDPNRPETRSGVLLAQCCLRGRRREREGRGGPGTRQATRLLGRHARNRVLFEGIGREAGTR